MKNPSLRIIGDVHGKYSNYLKLIQNVDFSIQLGDFGFDYSVLDEKISPEIHKILGGNHDNYERQTDQFIKQTPHFLKDFGILEVPQIGQIFYVRGGFSIDYKNRQIGINWWPDEEVSQSVAMQIIDLYKETKPTLMISHECPANINNFVSNFSDIKPSFTSLLLQELYDMHQPDVWFFGHHHKDWIKHIGNTEFNCLNELSYCDFYNHDFGDRHI